MDLSAVLLNVANVLFITPLTLYAWFIGKDIGFSRPWKFISGGFLIAIIGAFLRMIGEIIGNSPFPNFLDVGIIANIVSYILLLYGFYKIYKITHKHKGEIV
jgi:hypothetical protein